jgi:NADH-quinone oxidoreductase subunit M
MFALNRPGIEGSVLQMVNHGLSTGALFALVGMLYERYHTREIRDYGGLASRLPLFSACFLLFTLSSIGLPGLNGFAGEFLILLGAFQRGQESAAAGLAWQFQAIAVLAVLGVVLGAWYMLWLAQRLLFGPLREPGGGSHGADQVRDLGGRELAALAPLAALVVWIGVQPEHFLRTMRPALAPLAAGAEQRLAPGPRLARNRPPAPGGALAEAAR